MTVFAELSQVLKEHASRYPLMEPVDVVKLVYQNEFGGGHLIKNAQKSLEALCREWAHVLHVPGAERYEAIGSGLVRVMLSALDTSILPLEELNRAFVLSAQRHQGNMDRFLEKLNLVRAMTGDGVFSFSSDILERYLDGYRDQGYPMVSHSQVYHEAYHPAYRLVLRELLP